MRRGRLKREGFGPDLYIAGTGSTESRAEERLSAGGGNEVGGVHIWCGGVRVGDGTGTNAITIMITITIAITRGWAVKEGNRIQRVCALRRKRKGQGREDGLVWLPRRIGDTGEGERRRSGAG